MKKDERLVSLLTYELDTVFRDGVAEFRFSADSLERVRTYLKAQAEDPKTLRLAVETVYSFTVSLWEDAKKTRSNMTCEAGNALLSVVKESYGLFKHRVVEFALDNQASGEWQRFMGSDDIVLSTPTWKA